MAKFEGSRRDYLDIEALDPETGEPCTIQVSFDRMHAIARRGLGHAKECGYILPATLKGPTAIFEGLRQDEDEDRQGVGWRCYCGIPDKAYYADGSQRSPYPAQVYLVFVNEDGVAYNWRWEKADPGDLTLPQNHAIRFQKRLL